MKRSDSSSKITAKGVLARAAVTTALCSGVLGAGLGLGPVQAQVASLPKDNPGFQKLAQVNGGPITEYKNRSITSYWTAYYYVQQNHVSDIDKLVEGMAKVEPADVETPEGRQKWKVTFNKGPIDYRSAYDNYTANPYFTIFHSRDLRIVGNMKASLCSQDGRLLRTEDELRPYEDNQYLTLVAANDSEAGLDAANGRVFRALYQGIYPSSTNGKQTDDLKYRFNGGDSYFENNIEMSHHEYGTDVSGPAAEEPALRYTGSFTPDAGAVINTKLDTRGRLSNNTVVFEFETQRRLTASFPNDKEHKTYMAAHYKSYDHSTLSKEPTSK